MPPPRPDSSDPNADYLSRTKRSYCLVEQRRIVGMSGAVFLNCTRVRFWRYSSAGYRVWLAGIRAQSAIAFAYAGG